ncbi:hypothetical protein RYZ27_00465 [Hyphomonas sp. FCG-A18]|uniref:hypothetical protein n=1 Tax=Hyphomonas sp. FCG-A18 TaxID=3080019 RepID=UPI002B28429E|nr:hypothetical protein RYZ27_00465 [Hyphomonas sp. FCG-A18]
MSTSLTRQALPRLSEEQRADLIRQACNASKGRALEAIVSQITALTQELARLKEQIAKLEQPGGDRVMARMVKGRLEDGNRMAISLFKKALQADGYRRDDAYLRLIVAEHANAFGGAAREFAIKLQRIALDELLQTSSD